MSNIKVKPIVEYDKGFYTNEEGDLVETFWNTNLKVSPSVQQVHVKKNKYGESKMVGVSGDQVKAAVDMSHSHMSHEHGHKKIKDLAKAVKMDDDTTDAEDHHNTVESYHDSDQVQLKKREKIRRKMFFMKLNVKLQGNKLAYAKVQDLIATGNSAHVLTNPKLRKSMEKRELEKLARIGEKEHEKRKMFNLHMKKMMSMPQHEEAIGELPPEVPAVIERLVWSNNRNRAREGRRHAARRPAFGGRRGDLKTLFHSGGRLYTFYISAR